MIITLKIVGFLALVIPLDYIFLVIWWNLLVWK